MVNYRIGYFVNWLRIEIAEFMLIGGRSFDHVEVAVCVSSYITISTNFIAIAKNQKIENLYC